MRRLFRKRRARTSCPPPATPALCTAQLVHDAAGTLPFVVLTVDEDADLDTPERTRAAAAQYAALADRLLVLADQQNSARQAIAAFRALTTGMCVQEMDTATLAPRMRARFTGWYDHGEICARPTLVLPAGQDPVQRLAAARRLLGATTSERGR